MFNDPMMREGSGQVCLRSSCKSLPVLIIATFLAVGCMLLVNGTETVSADPDPTPISITTVEGFNAITDMTATYSLDADLNFNNTDSGLKDKDFKGHLIGNDHQITNLTSQLFGHMSGAGNVEHLSIQGNISGTDTGLLCQNLSGTVSYITLSGDVESYGSGFVGGLCSVSNGTISHVTNNATVHGSNDLGGIAGKISGGTVDSCINHANITSTTHRAAGIAGFMTGGTVTNAENDGNMAGKLDVAGIIGSCEGGTVNGRTHDCTITGGDSVGGICGYIGNMWNISSQTEFVKNVNLVGGQGVGGYVGFCDGGNDLQNVKVTNINITSSSERKSSADTGGVVGKTNVSVRKCTANGDINVTNYGVCTGGIVGYGYRVYFSDLHFTGSVKSNSDNVGGVIGAVGLNGYVGLSRPTYSITGCSADATVKGDSCVGGILGLVDPLNNSMVTWYFEIETSVTSGTLEGLYHVGGTLGKGRDTLIADVTNNMNVSGRNQVGGISGGCARVNYSTNNGNVSATGTTDVDTNCGGIGGYTHFASTGCTNNGSVTANGEYIINVGGIFGWTGTDVSNMTNNGNVTSTGSRIGGIVGCFNGSSVSDCSNKGNVTGKDYVAGIIGVAHNGTTNYCTNTGIITATDGDSNEDYNTQRPENKGMCGLVIAMAIALISCGVATPILTRFRI